jgi:hypothetical protein
MPKTNKPKNTPKPIITDALPKSTAITAEVPKQKPGAKPGDDWQAKYKHRKKRATRYTASKSFKTTPEASNHIKSCAKSLGMSESKYLRDISQLPFEKVKKLLSEGLTN